MLTFYVASDSKPNEPHFFFHSDYYVHLASCFMGVLRSVFADFDVYILRFLVSKNLVNSELKPGDLFVVSIYEFLDFLVLSLPSFR